MSKPICLVSCPIDTYSGYGARARDFVDALIESRPDWDIRILKQKWGNTRWGFLKQNNREDLLKLCTNTITKKPDVWIQISIPNEFQPVGNFNIGVTAGIESDKPNSTWIEGLNRMDLNLVSSHFSKRTFEKGFKDEQKGISLTPIKPIEVLFEGYKSDVYKKVQVTDDDLNLSKVQEDFNFLVTGTWINPKIGKDRKNIGLSILTFLETFKNRKDAPGLILKILRSNNSILELEQITKLIQNIRSSVEAEQLPNVYLLYGDLTDQEMNYLYNHPKVSCMFSLTKGEGFGRPLLEFTLSSKPLIVSNWSGHKDFLIKEGCVFIGGSLEDVNEEIVDGNSFIKGAKWFSPNTSEVTYALNEVFKNYKKYQKRAKAQQSYSYNNFDYSRMQKRLKNIIDKKVPTYTKVNLPDLTKLKLPKIPNQ